MGGISNNLDLQRLNATQQTGTRSVKAGALKSKDPRMSMNGSIFAGQVGGASKTQTTQSTPKDYSDISKSEAKQIQSSSQQESANNVSDMNKFMQTAANYQTNAAQDMKDSAKIEKDLKKETKNLTKAQKNFEKYTKTEPAGKNGSPL